MRKKKTQHHWFDQSMEKIDTCNLVPGQDRFFVRQMKPPAQIGYILFSDLLNTNYKIHTLRGDVIAYKSLAEIDTAGWILD